ncbi:bifunctional glutamate N-acetyltransferase/amino-acid acetyltransferase ArgJ [Neomegalonema perideroedes]|uniref:bifunctional glutamate N-acetyltransferase/amino-acid acetyltransferase ArgJ n=1 Tax=Neomegalonema perideroedes TaxID=217219 RepID=UPI0003678161|nr:bifunctional glutamate N-acetyltransferase/amino-acid acetyltransferase ArgJ [Neomegalonema perideroedes]
MADIAKLKAKLKKRKAKLLKLKAKLATLKAHEAAQALTADPSAENPPQADAKTAAAPAKKAPAPVSPFAPEGGFPALPPVPGITLAGAAAGVKYKGRLDVMLAKIAPGGAAAGVYTRSATRSAPVLWCEAITKSLNEGGKLKGPLGILVNSGNSNAFTGSVGAAAVEKTAAAAAEALGGAGAVFVASTGVIGQHIDYQKILDVLPDLAARQAPEAWEDGARAIMTTDTFPKAASAQVEIEGVPVTLVGFAKGSGMIAPDMATMLGFVFTDANIGQAALQQALSGATEASFNSITVDSDTSTSDTIVLASSRKAKHERIETAKDPRAAAFVAALNALLLELAQLVVKDGEGATKFVEFHVTGAKSAKAAKKIGLAIANSPLVKTALAGQDPNWGRIVMAVGKSGEAADRDKLAIWFGEALVAENGLVSPEYQEETGAAYFKRSELAIRVDVGVGKGEARVWTCDLTKRYIEINADYRS